MEFLGHFSFSVESNLMPFFNDLEKQRSLIMKINFPKKILGRTVGALYQQIIREQVNLLTPELFLFFNFSTTCI